MTAMAHLANAQVPALSLIAGSMASLLAPAGQRARLSILLYHRVLPTIDPLTPGEVDAAVFDRQMQCLAACFNVLPLSEAVERLQRGSLPSRAACVTFDDGYADNAEVALPILRRHGICAAFFIATGFLDGGWMFNDRVIESVRVARGERLDLTAVGLPEFDISTTGKRGQTIDTLLAAVKYLPPRERDSRIDQIVQIVGARVPPGLMMRSEQVRELHDAGMEIGGHTVNHPILARLDRDKAQAEIAGGKERLENIIRAPVTLFAYPNGKPATDYTRDHIAIVKDLGFKAALSTATGVATGASDSYQLPRFLPWDKNPAKYAIRLLQNLRRTQPVQV